MFQFFFQMFVALMFAVVAGLTIYVTVLGYSIRHTRFHIERHIPNARRQLIALLVAVVMTEGMVIIFGRSESRSGMFYFHLAISMIFLMSTGLLNWPLTGKKFPRAHGLVAGLVFLPSAAASIVTGYMFLFSYQPPS